MVVEDPRRSQVASCENAPMPTKAVALIVSAAIAAGVLTWSTGSLALGLALAGASILIVLLSLRRRRLAAEAGDLHAILWTRIEASPPRRLFDDRTAPPPRRDPTAWRANVQARARGRLVAMVGDADVDQD